MKQKVSRFFRFLIALHAESGDSEIGSLINVIGIGGGFCAWIVALIAVPMPLKLAVLPSLVFFGYAGFLVAWAGAGLVVLSMLIILGPIWLAGKAIERLQDERKSKDDYESHFDELRDGDLLPSELVLQDEDYFDYEEEELNTLHSSL